MQLHQADAQAVELLRTRLAAAGLRVQLLDQSAADAGVDVRLLLGEPQ